MAENKNQDKRPIVIMSGLPGKMATLVAETILKSLKSSEDFIITLVALTGPDQPEYQDIKGSRFLLYGPDRHEEILKTDASLRDLFRRESNPHIVVDFTQPDAVNRNAELYCKLKIPFVMGTTGGDKGALEKVVQDSGNLAVIAPNMAKPIVLMQAMLEYAAQNFPNSLKGFNLEIVESHQSIKKDTSGTAKAMVQYFNQLGIPFVDKEIVKIRDPQFQTRLIGVLEQYLSGHGWHTYTLKSQDKTVELGFTHNVNGRQVYADGTLDAIRFLYGKLGKPESKGKVYSMIDVLKAE